MAGWANNLSKKIKIVLLSVILITVGITGVTYWGVRRVSEKTEKLQLPLMSGADVSLGSLNHTATRDGVKEWTLKAASARLMNTRKRLVLKNISVVYFMKESKKAYLTAKRGILDTESNDIEVTGNVVLISEPYELKTEKLNYRHKARKISTDLRVRITSTSAYLMADAMSFDLKTEKALFRGNVEGLFAGKFRL